MSTSPQSGKILGALPSEPKYALSRLLHEVRQPLSGIESIAYYLEIALDYEDPEIHQQCSRLRALVRHANWLLDDAAIGTGPAGETSCLNTEVFNLAEQLALHEEQAMELNLSAGAMPVPVSGATLKRIAQHAMSFLRDVAEAGDPLGVATARGEGLCILRMGGRVDPEKCTEFRRLLTVLGPEGLVGVMTQLGGELVVPPSGELLEIELRFPAIAH